MDTERNSRISKPQPLLSRSGGRLAEKCRRGCCRPIKHRLGRGFRRRRLNLKNCGSFAAAWPSLASAGNLELQHKGTNKDARIIVCCTSTTAGRHISSRPLHKSTVKKRTQLLSSLLSTLPRQAVEMAVESERVTEAKKLAKTDPDAAAAKYKDIISKSPSVTSDTAIREYEGALIGLGELYRDQKSVAQPKCVRCEAWALTKVL
jgi:hypothetical protein